MYINNSLNIIKMYWNQKIKYLNKKQIIVKFKDVKIILML